MRMLMAIGALLSISVAAVFWNLEPTAAAQAKAKPLRALYITGGCCHDYNKQKIIISEGVSARANVTWTIVQEDAKKGVPKVYASDDWAKNYDVVVHNECWAGIKDDAVVEKIVKAHTDQGVGVVMIHCAMHTFRGAKTKEWDNLVGVYSVRHGAKFPITVKTLSKHPIMSTVPADWVTKNGELYHTQPLPNTTALAEGTKGGDEKTKQVCVWISTHGKSRTFGTTLGHHNATMEDPVWLDMLTRGILWTCKKLDKDGKPVAGFGKQTSAE